MYIDEVVTIDEETGQPVKIQVQVHPEYPVVVINADKQHEGDECQQLQS